MSASTKPDALDIAGLEALYDHLAQAIDLVGERKATLFLVKLALLNAKTIGDVQQVLQHIDAAHQDL